MSGLTYDHAIEILRYDAENGALRRKLRNGEWRVCGHKPNSRDGYGQVEVDGKKYKTHRLIWLLVHGSWPKHEIDHINRDRMDNRIDNLREVSTAENAHNQRLRKNNSSGYPGAYFNKRANKFMAYIRINGKCTNLGYYNTAEEAFEAYQLAKIEYHPTSPIAQEYRRELGLVAL